ncbi:MAG: helix-turn-helix domain-containing protein [Tagaea sp.]
MRARTLAIARGELRQRPDAPRVWFSSMESLAQILSAANRALLDTIRRERPGSLAELAALTGRRRSNLSRTLRTMAGYGIVAVARGPRGRLIVAVPYDRLELDLPLARAA